MMKWGPKARQKHHGTGVGTSVRQSGLRSKPKASLMADSACFSIAASRSHVYPSLGLKTGVPCEHLRHYSEAWQRQCGNVDALCGWGLQCILLAIRQMIMAGKLGITGQLIRLSRWSTVSIG